MRKLKKSEYVLLGALMLIGAFPLATSPSDEGMFFDLKPLAEVLDVRHEAARDRRNVRTNLREYEEVLRICMERAKTDDTVECPDINDTSAIRRFLKGGRKVEVETDTGSTLEIEEPRKRMIDFLDLEGHERAILRRFQNVGRCPERLNEILPGLFDLCKSTLRGQGAMGILNDIATIERGQNDAE